MFVRSQRDEVDRFRNQLSMGHCIIYSGRSDNHHDRRVALIIHKEVETSLIEWKPINDRQMSARFNSTFAKLTVIVHYAPTEVSEDEEKDVFYDKPQEVLVIEQHQFKTCS